MKCPKCEKGDVQFVERFLSPSGKMIIRIWRCDKCNAYFKDKKRLFPI